MLASVGWMVQKNGLGLIPFPDGASLRDSPLHTLSSDPLVAAQQLPAGGWWQLFFVCGVIELYTESKGKHYMSEPRFTALDDFKGIGDDSESMQLKELKNGRLAMIAMAATLAHEINPGFVPVPMWD